MTDEPLKLGRGEIFFGDSSIPIGRAESLTVRPAEGVGDSQKWQHFVDGLTKAFEGFGVQAKFAGFTMNQLGGLWLDRKNKRWRQSEGEKVFYRKRRTRSMKGK